MYAYFRRGRDPLSSYTHFLGALAGAVGTLLLALRGWRQTSGAAVVAGAMVFGVSLVALYAASSLYHYVLCGPGLLKRLRKLDHAMIYVLIAGSYTPFCIRYMAPRWLPLFLGWSGRRLWQAS